MQKLHIKNLVLLDFIEYFIYFKGITSPIISSSLENSALFSTYGFLRRIQGVKRIL